MSVLTMSLKQFREFVKYQVDTRGEGSARKFAQLADINPGVINKFLDYKNDDPGYPSVETILKIAKACNYDPVEVFKLLVIDDQRRPVSADDIELALRIQELPEGIRTAIDAMLIGAALRQRDSQGE